MIRITEKETPESGVQRIQYRFVPVPETLLMMDPCPLRAQLLHFWQVLYKNSRACGYAWFARSTVAEWLGVSVRTVQRWINALKEKHLLWVARTGRSSEYTLINTAVENLRKVTSEVPDLAHRIKDDLDLKPTLESIVGSDSEVPVENLSEPKKVAAPAAPSLKTLPAEEFLNEFRRLKQQASLDHAQAARGQGSGEIVRRILGKMGFKPPE
jgi:hypothetical protein